MEILVLAIFGLVFLIFKKDVFGSRKAIKGIAGGLMGKSDNNNTLPSGGGDSKVKMGSEIANERQNLNPNSNQSSNPNKESVDIAEVAQTALHTVNTISKIASVIPTDPATKAAIMAVQKGSEIGEAYVKKNKKQIRGFQKAFEGALDKVSDNKNGQENSKQNLIEDEKKENIPGVKKEDNGEKKKGIREIAKRKIKNIKKGKKLLKDSKKDDIPLLEDKQANKNKLFGNKKFGRKYKSKSGQISKYAHWDTLKSKEENEKIHSDRLKESKDDSGQISKYAHWDTSRSKEENEKIHSDRLNESKEDIEKNKGKETVNNKNKRRFSRKISRRNNNRRNNRSNMLNEERRVLELSSGNGLNPEKVEYLQTDTDPYIQGLEYKIDEGLMGLKGEILSSDVKRLALEEVLKNEDAFKNFSMIVELDSQEELLTADDRRLIEKEAESQISMANMRITQEDIDRANDELMYAGVMSREGIVDQNELRRIYGKSNPEMVELLDAGREKLERQGIPQNVIDETVNSLAGKLLLGDKLEDIKREKVQSELRKKVNAITENKKKEKEKELINNKIKEMSEKDLDGKEYEILEDSVGVEIAAKLKTLFSNSTDIAENIMNIRTNRTPIHVLGDSRNKKELNTDDINKLRNSNNNNNVA